jgi:hypothetical protein
MLRLLDRRSVLFSVNVKVKKESQVPCTPRELLVSQKILQKDFKKKEKEKEKRESARQGNNGYISFTQKPRHMKEREPGAETMADSCQSELRARTVQ